MHIAYNSKTVITTWKWSLFTIFLFLPKGKRLCIFSGCFVGLFLSYNLLEKLWTDFDEMCVALVLLKVKGEMFKFCSLSWIWIKVFLFCSLWEVDCRQFDCWPQGKGNLSYSLNRASAYVYHCKFLNFLLTYNCWNILL